MRDSGSRHHPHGKKGALAKLRGPHSAKAAWSLKRRLMPHGPWKDAWSQKERPNGCHVWVKIPAPVFPCSPISHASHNQLHLPAFPILPALLGCHSKSGQVWPHGTEPIFSKLSRRCCNQGELTPSYNLGGSHSYPPGSKLGHSHLTYLWDQLKFIDTLNDHARG